MEKDQLQKVIHLRRQIHKYPQPELQQYQTRQRVKKILKQFGILQNQMYQIQPTALYVDISGKAQPKGENKCVAFRADMDALNMQQQNQHLQYRSVIKGVAHMCGHDGHVACLIGLVPILQKNLDKIPSNKTVRLLFQPAQQGGTSGAKIMVQNGCLQGVNQVYGMHNWPTQKIGQLWCMQGPIFTQITILKIILKGTSGHGSQPHKVLQCTRAGVQFYQKAYDYLDDLQKQKKGVLVCTLPILQAGQTYNVISDTCKIQGSIRSYQQGLAQKIIEQFRKICSNIEKKGYKTQIKYQTYPMTINSKKQTQNVLRVGKQFFGQQNVGQGQFPDMGSQDFCYFSMVKPGAYFALTTGDVNKADMFHCTKYDFNDDLIQKAALFWYKLAQDRLL